MAANPQPIPVRPHLSDADKQRLERGISEFANRGDGNGELIIHFCQGSIRRVEIKRVI